MAGSRNGREDYTLIREFMSNICLYGCLSREDFIGLGICSGAAYDQCTRLLRSVVPELTPRRVDSGRKSLHLPRQYAPDRESRIADTYLLHTIRETELAEFLVLLQRLDREPATTAQLAAELELHGGMEGSSRYNAARSHRQTLESWGCLETRGRESRLEKDLLTGLTDRQLRDLGEFIRFRCQTAHPRVAGTYLLRSIRRELAARGAPPLGPMPVLLRRNESCGIFDEDLAFRLRELIRQRRYVQLRCRGQSVLALPVELRVDRRLGRWYLLYWDGAPRMARLSHLEPGKPGAVAPDWDALAERVRHAFACSGVSAFRDGSGPCLVEARLLSGESVRRRFRRDIRLGQTVLENGEEFYRARVNDPGELVPLLRQYAPDLALTPGQEELRQRLRQDLLAQRRHLEEDL